MKNRCTRPSVRRAACGLALVSFAVVGPGCAISAVSNDRLSVGDIQEASRAVTPAPIVARGVFAAEADRARFETDVLPSARAFLASWATVGLTVPHGSARIFVSPPPGNKASEVLAPLYGEGIFDEMAALENAVATAASKKVALEAIDAFTCEHPPLDRKFLEDMEKYLDDESVSVAKIAQALKKKHEDLRAPTASFTFRTDNGEFEMPRRQNCSYLLLGHSTTTTRAHPYLEKDVVNHELGHALHYRFWKSTGVVGERLSASLNEALGDILAHVFDGDACHGKVLDAQGATVGCRRNMVGYAASVSDAVWVAGRGTHDTGQALRDFVWTLRSDPDVATEPEALKRAIREGMNRAIVALRAIDREPLSNVPVFDDDILAIRYRFAREYDATSAFFDGVCATFENRPRVCAQREARIGSERSEVRARFMANAPTSIGEAGLGLSDGRRVAFRFEGASLKEIRATAVDGTVHTFAATPSITRDPITGEVHFAFVDGARQAAWSSLGELDLRE